MSIFEVGRMCMKIAGRDAGRNCVVVEQLDDRFVVIDGNTRRKKVNIRHLEPLDQVIELKDKASHEQVKTAFEKQGWSVWETKPKQAGIRPRRLRTVKKKTPAPAKKPAKAAAQKEKKVDEKPKITVKKEE